MWDFMAGLSTLQAVALFVAVTVVWCGLVRVWIRD